MADEALLDNLSAVLQNDIASFAMSANTAGASRALRRLNAVACYFPPFLALLVEPWQERTDPEFATTLLHCARVHLYARVLDDALDENLPIDRQHLLRMQPLFWRTVFALGACYPALQEPCAALIAETVQAVAQDGRQARPKDWGAKNHHLLLAPLLLSGNNDAFRAAQPGLSGLIAVAQACEEREQGELARRHMPGAVLACLPGWLDAQAVASLARHGWQSAARRLLRDGRGLLDSLEYQYTGSV